MERKHHKNRECCPRHSLFKGHNVNVNIVRHVISVSSLKSQVTSLLDCSLRVLSKCHVHCHSLFLSGLCLCHCLFVGQVMSPHHSTTLIRCLVLIFLIVLIVIILIYVIIVIIVIIVILVILVIIVIIVFFCVFYVFSSL